MLLNFIFDQFVTWTSKKYLFILIQNRENHKIRNAQVNFLNFAYIELIQNKNFLQFLNSQRKTYFLQCRDWDWITKNFRNELKTLMRDETFDKFQKSTKIIKWNFLIDFIAFKTTMKRYVFRWLKIIKTISIDFKFSRNYHHIRERQFIIFFTFCYYLHSRKFSNF